MAVDRTPSNTYSLPDSQYKKGLSSMCNSVPNLAKIPAFGQSVGIASIIEGEVRA